MITLNTITLKQVLKANALSCILFGLVFLTASTSVAEFLSTDNAIPELLLPALGAGLILNGLHLFWTSFNALPSKSLILYFSFGDFLWVLASLGLVSFSVWITTTPGIVSSLAIAAMIGVFGVLQMTKRKALGRNKLAEKPR